MLIDDTTGTLSAADRANIENAASARMDVKVVIASTGSRAELDASVGRLVNSGNTLAIGVDPVHHYTFTHFGSALGISSSDYQVIARSGNVDFKAGHWADGLRAIVTSAGAAQREHVAQSSGMPVIIQQPQTVIEHPVSPIPFVIGGLVIVALFWGIISWLRRRERDAEQARQAFREETERMQARNLEEQGWHDRMAQKQEAPTPAAPTPQAPFVRPTTVQELLRVPRTVIRERVVSAGPPVIVQQQGGSGDMLTGLVIGQALAERREPVYERARHYTPAPTPSSSSSSWDSGSSSSSWDSGSSGGSFDSGSSGGGFDSGSSGSDF